MARYQSGSGSHWGVYFDDGYSQDGHGATISLTAGMYADSGWSFSTSSNTISWSSSTGAGGSATRSVDFGPGGSVQLISGSFYVPRTHSAQSVTVTATLDRTGSSFMPGKASASHTYTIPARESHTYRFDANGGSGAPGNVTKWYGEQLAVPSTKPTRTNYSFLGWSTSSTASSADYQAGGSYWTPDKATTLYAVWRLDYVAPAATLTACRVASDESTTEDALGGYACVSASWAKGSKDVTSISISDTGKHTWSSTSATSGSSGTYVARTALAAADSVTVTVTIADGTGTTTRSATIGATTPPIDIGNKGKAVGIFEAVDSSKTGLHVGGKMWCGSTQDLRVLYYTSKPDESAIPVKPCIVVLADGSMYLVS